MEIQGVVFYTLAGDHAQAGPRKLRVGIPGTKTSLNTFRSIVCEIHNINLIKFRLDVQSFTTREPLPPNAEVKNYDELRVICTRKQMKDIIEEEASDEKRRVESEQAVKEREIIASIRTNMAADDSTVERRNGGLGIASSEQQQQEDTKLLKRMSVISMLSLPVFKSTAASSSTSLLSSGGTSVSLLSAPSLPLTASTETTTTPTTCALCSMDLFNPMETSCCSRWCCRRCHGYAMSLIDDSTCPLCGKSQSSAIDKMKQHGGGDDVGKTLLHSGAQTPCEVVAAKGVVKSESMSTSGSGSGARSGAEAPTAVHHRNRVCWTCDAVWTSYLQNVVPSAVLKALEEEGDDADVDNSGSARKQKKRERDEGTPLTAQPLR